MNLNQKVTMSQQVIAREIGDQLVILELTSGTYFGLDAVGARIWQLMSKGKDLAEICEDMLDEYDVSPEELKRDIKILLEELSTRKLINPV